VLSHFDRPRNGRPSPPECGTSRPRSVMRPARLGLFRMVRGGVVGAAGWIGRRVAGRG
jgi:hypothetical protein